MKIVLATYGSRGDVQPMLALSLALKSAGHDVVLAAPPEKKGWAEALGCPFRPIGEDVTAYVDGMKDAHSFRSAVGFISFLRRQLSRQFEMFPKILAGADLTVGSSLAFALPSIAEGLGIAYRYIAFTPQLLPSGSHPFLACKHHRLPGWVNRTTWHAVRLFDRFNLTRLVNRERRKFGLKPVGDVWPHVLGKRIIVACDKAIAAVPEDVTLPSVQTGYMHLDLPDRHEPKLEAFLRAGPPPVYAGFGSMPKQDQARNVPLILRAARLAGQRVVVCKFWEEPAASSDARDVLFIRGYPHARLFPRMAAVIHHGGAGTTAAGAVSGIPQIIIPHALDQYYWAHKVYNAHLGPKPIWRSKLTSQRLADAIGQCVSNERMRGRTNAVSKMIQGQNGLQMTVRELIETRD